MDNASNNWPACNPTCDQLIANKIMAANVEQIEGKEHTSE